MERRKFIKNIVAVSAVVGSITLPNALMAKETKKEIEKFSQVKSLNTMSYEQAVKEIIGDKELKISNKVKLRVPGIAENGAVIPIVVTVDNPMSKQNYVKAIHILNSISVNPRCATIMLTPTSKAYFSTRMKSPIGTPTIVAIIELSDGRFIKAEKSLKVTIGGCG